MEEVVDRVMVVPGVTNVDMVDDKINNTLSTWKLYGIQTHPKEDKKMKPTNDKKMKPDIHTVASIETGMIWALKPETIGMKLGEILKELIQSVLPSDQPTLRAQLSFFIDQGYLEIAKSQSSQVANLIQIMEEVNVMFCRTIKNNSTCISQNQTLSHCRWYKYVRLWPK